MHQSPDLKTLSLADPRSGFGSVASASIIACACIGVRKTKAALQWPKIEGVSGQGGDTDNSVPETLTALKTSPIPVRSGSPATDQALSMRSA
jgi:hypothetical protein